MIEKKMEKKTNEIKMNSANYLMHNLKSTDTWWNQWNKQKISELKTIYFNTLKEKVLKKNEELQKKFKSNQINYVNKFYHQFNQWVDYVKHK